MTTNYPPDNTPTEPTGPRDVPGDAAWGCVWWWWIILLIIILIVWFGGWGWGSYGGWWFRGRRAVPPPAPNPTVPGMSGVPANPAPRTNPVPPATHPTMWLVPPGSVPGTDRATTVALTAANWPNQPPVG